MTVPLPQEAALGGATPCGLTVTRCPHTSCEEWIQPDSVSAHRLLHSLNDHAVTVLSVAECDETFADMARALWFQILDLAGGG
jgi:hypothetical protein